MRVMMTAAIIRATELMNAKRRVANGVESESNPPMCGVRELSRRKRMEIAVLLFESMPSS